MWWLHSYRLQLRDHGKLWIWVLVRCQHTDLPSPWMGWSPAKAHSRLTANDHTSRKNQSRSAWLQITDRSTRTTFFLLSLQISTASCKRRDNEVRDPWGNIWAIYDVVKIMKSWNLLLISYLTWIITGVPLAHPLEDMIESQNVAHLMDHGVLVANGTKVGWVQNHTTWRQIITLKVWLIIFKFYFDIKVWKTVLQTCEPVPYTIETLSPSYTV